MKEVKLPSGAILRVQLAPFADSRALFQSVVNEFNKTELNKDSDSVQISKNAFCMEFGSPEIERCFWKCAERCNIDRGDGAKLKISEELFEDPKCRGDYASVRESVIKENIAPFGKGLSPAFAIVFGILIGDLQ